MPIISNPTVRQHQVQQKYLEGWCDANKKLWIYRKEDHHLFNTSTINVLLRKAYYKIKPINEQEKKFLLDWIGEPTISNFVSKTSIRTPEDIINTIPKILAAWGKVQNQEIDLFLHSIDLLIFYAESIGLMENLQKPSEKKFEEEFEEAQKFLSNISMQCIESYYCGIEEAGMPVMLNILAGRDISLDDMRDLMSYLCVQYFRTSEMGQIIEGNPFPQVDMSNIRPILQFYLGLKLSDSMNTRKSDFILIENNTSTNFLTGSQPIINILAVPNQKTNELQFYYPISPNRALLVFPNGSKQYSKQSIFDVSIVDEYNKKMISSSETLVSKEKGDSEQYILI